MTHKLAQLLSPWLNLENNTQVSGVQLDSRKVEKGDLFVAVQGALVDGRQFITTAIHRGAGAVLSETQDPQLHGELSVQLAVPIIHFYRLSQHLSALAAEFYGLPGDKLKLIAVTGTNGKSTITSLIANWLTLLDKKAGQLGTLGNGLYGQLSTCVNTTGSAIEVQQQLAQMSDAGAGFVAMEVSSHGLVQNRIAAVPFTTAIFTNLSRDHLDYHGDMSSYESAKQRLFHFDSLKYRIINADDPAGRRWLTVFPEAIPFGESVEPDERSDSFLKVDQLKLTEEGLSFEIRSSWGNGFIKAPLYGRFNASNLAAALTALLAHGFALDDLIKQAQYLAPVAGRMELYRAHSGAGFIVDYAHTPDALEQALKAIKPHCRGQLWCLFGCGGDRDKGKRPQMAAIAESYSNKVVVVDDNPRNESAQLIVEDIKTGFLEPSMVSTIHDRKKAIEFAYSKAVEGDIVLIAGKGHEDYQIIGDKVVPYSDRDVISSLLEGEAE